MTLRVVLAARDWTPVATLSSGVSGFLPTEQLYCLGRK
jgi:hypothetical protein